MTQSAPVAPVDSAANAPAWTRLLALVLLAAPLVFFALFNATYFAWGDEVQFVDPAASAYFGKGFTSTAWPYQTSKEVFAGNAPGYSLLLVPWFAVWGFGLDQARWLNVPLAYGAALIILSALRQVAPKMPFWLMALAVCTSYFGVGALISGGSARYDVLGLLVAAWIFKLLCAAPRTDGRAALMLAGAATFYAGFHLVAALVIVLLLLVAQDRRRFSRAALFLGFGISLGMATWLAVLTFEGLFIKFFIMLFGSQHTLSGQMAKLVLQGDKSVLGKINAFRSLATLDWSLTVVAILLVALLAAQWLPTGARDTASAAGTANRLIGWLAIDFAFILPLALLFIGKFPVYYSWIAYVPAVLITCIWSWRSFERSSRWPLMAFVGVATVAATLGLGQRILYRDIDPGSATYGDFNSWVKASLKPDDIVYADHEAYFAARSVASRVLVPTYGQTALVRGIPERDLLTALVVQNTHVTQVVALVGGEWNPQGSFVPPALTAGLSKLDFTLLRRAVKPAP